MKIVIHLFDTKDNAFKKLHFAGWNGKRPILVFNPRKAKNYWNEKQAQADLEKIKKMRSARAKTLSVKLEEQTNG